MKKILIALFLFGFVLCSVIPVGALTLPNPTTDPLLYPGVPTALPYGDFWSYSLPILAFFEDKINPEVTGTGPGNPYYVVSTPGAIKDGIVVATGASGGPVNQNFAGMDNAYPTPSGVGGSPIFSTTTVSDPGQVGGSFTGDGDNTWDISLGALDTFLKGGTDTRSPLVFFFNNNQNNPTEGNQSLQSLLAWAQVVIEDSDGVQTPIYLDFTNSNQLPQDFPPTTTSDPGTYTSPGAATSNWPESPLTGLFPVGPNAFPVADPIGTNLQDIILSGGPVTFMYEGEEITINHNLGANQAAYAIWSPEIDANLGAWMGAGYDVMRLDIRLAALNNGYEQIFILRTDQVTNIIPEPATMILLGTGLLGLAGLGRKKFRKKS